MLIFKDLYGPIRVLHNFGSLKYAAVEFIGTRIAVAEVCGLRKRTRPRGKRSD
jgi:hypothetical protein